MATETFVGKKYVIYSDGAYHRGGSGFHAGKLENAHLYRCAKSAQHVIDNWLNRYNRDDPRVCAVREIDVTLCDGK